MEIHFDKMISPADITLFFLLHSALQEARSVEEFEYFLNDNAFSAAEKQKLHFFLTGQLPTPTHPIDGAFKNLHHLVAPLINRLLCEKYIYTHAENIPFFKIFFTPGFFKFLTYEDIKALHFPADYYYGSSELKRAILIDFFNNQANQPVALSRFSLLLKNKSIRTRLVYEEEMKVDAQFLHIILSSPLAENIKEAFFRDIHDDNPQIMEELKRTLITHDGSEYYTFPDYYFTKNHLPFFDEMNFFANCHLLPSDEVEKYPQSTSLFLMQYIDLYKQNPALSCLKIITDYAFSPTIATLFLIHAISQCQLSHPEKIAAEKEIVLAKQKNKMAVTTLEYFFLCITFIFHTATNASTQHEKDIKKIDFFLFWGKHLFDSQQHSFAAADLLYLDIAKKYLKEYQEKFYTINTPSHNENTLADTFSFIEATNKLAMISPAYLRTDILNHYVLGSNSSLRVDLSTDSLWQRHYESFLKTLILAPEEPHYSAQFLSLQRQSVAYYEFFKAIKRLLSLLRYYPAQRFFRRTSQPSQLAEIIEQLQNAITIYQEANAIYPLCEASVYNYWQAQYEKASLENQTSLTTFFHRFKNAFDKQTSLFHPFAFKPLFKKLQAFIQDPTSIEREKIYLPVKGFSAARTEPFNIPLFKRWPHEQLLDCADIYHVLINHTGDSFKDFIREIALEIPNEMSWLKNNETFFHDFIFYYFFIQTAYQKQWEVRKFNTLMKYLHHPRYLNFYNLFFVTLSFDLKNMLHFISGLDIPTDFILGTSLQKKEAFQAQYHHPQFESFLLAALNNATLCKHLIFIHDPKIKHPYELDFSFLEILFSPSFSKETKQTISKIILNQDKPIKAALLAFQEKSDSSFMALPEITPYNDMVFAIKNDTLLSACVADEQDSHGMIWNVTYIFHYMENSLDESNTSHLDDWQRNFSLFISLLTRIFPADAPVTTSVIASVHLLLSELYWLEAGMHSIDKTLLRNERRIRNPDWQGEAKYLLTLIYSIEHLEKALAFYSHHPSPFLETIIFNYWLTQKIYLETISDDQEFIKYEQLLKQDFYQACSKQYTLFKKLFQNSTLNPFLQEFKRQQQQPPQASLKPETSCESPAVEKPLVKSVTSASRPTTLRRISFKHDPQPSNPAPKLHLQELLEALPFKEKNPAIETSPAALPPDPKEADLTKLKMLLQLNEQAVPKNIKQFALNISVEKMYAAMLPNKKETTAPMYFCWVGDHEDALARFAIDQSISIKGSVESSGVVLTAELGYRVRHATKDLREHGIEISFYVEENDKVTHYTFVLFGLRTLGHHHYERSNASARVSYELNTMHTAIKLNAGKSTLSKLKH